MERKKGQRYSNEFRWQAVERMNSCGNIVGLARELGICRIVLYNWRERLDETDPPPQRSGELMLRKQIIKLKRLFSDEDPGSGFFQTCLVKSRSSTSAEGYSWRQGIYDEISTSGNARARFAWRWPPRLRASTAARCPSRACTCAPGRSSSPVCPVSVAPLKSAANSTAPRKCSATPRRLIRSLPVFG